MMLMKLRPRPMPTSPPMSAKGRNMVKRINKMIEFITYSTIATLLRSFCTFTEKRTYEVCHFETNVHFVFNSRVFFHKYM